MRLPTPKEYCEAYIKRVYEDAPLVLEQTIEVTLAFHAGIEAACKFMMEDFNADNEDNDDILAKRLSKFRSVNKTRALHVNMTRFAAVQNEKNN